MLISVIIQQDIQKFNNIPGVPFKTRNSIHPSVCFWSYQAIYTGYPKITCQTLQVEYMLKNNANILINRLIIHKMFLKGVGFP